MNSHQKSVAETCLRAAESGAMTFPQIAGTLMQEGFESYTIDFRRGVATYYLPDGDTTEVPTHRVSTSLAARFDGERIRDAIRDAQELVPGYTYLGFCATVADAGCAGYTVSFAGRRAIYIGRTGEAHVEHFPD